VSVVVVAAAVPLRFIVTPLPAGNGLTVPEMLKEPVTALAVKLTLPMLTPLIVMVWLAGVNVNPDFEGVTVYVPFARPPKL